MFSKKGKFRQRQTHTEANDVETQGEDSVQLEKRVPVLEMVGKCQKLEESRKRFNLDVIYLNKCFSSFFI